MYRKVVLVAFAAATVASLACSDKTPSGPGADLNTLVFTRADHSVIAFASGAQVFVWCGPWEEGFVATPSLQILFGGPAQADPRWHLRAVVADVAVGQPLPFPNGFIWDQPKDVDVFLADAPNELSTTQSPANGSVTFQRFQCGSGGSVEFSIDAVLGSEFWDGPSVGVSGSFRAAVGQPPS